MGILTGYKTYIGGAGFILIGVGNAAVGYYETGVVDWSSAIGYIATGLTIIGIKHKIDRGS